MSGMTYPEFHKATAVAGIVASLPLAFFVTANVLKYELGVLPGIEIPAIHPLLLVGGVMIALGLNAWSLFGVVISRRGRRWRLVLDITAHRWNLLSIAFGMLFFVAMILYLVVENFVGSFGG